MNDQLDGRVLEALGALDVPDHAPGFDEERRRRLEVAARERRQALRSRGRLRLLAAAASLAAVAAVLAFTLIGLPGTRVGGPEAATAAQVIARMQAAVNDMSTLSGRLMVTSAATGHVTYTYRFATTAAGDLSVSRSDGKETLTYDSRSRVALRVIDLGADGAVAEETTGLASGPPDEGPPQWILQRYVGAAVRALAAAKSPTVRQDTLGGRTVWVLSAAVQPNRLALPDASGDHLEVAVDQATGFPLRIVETRVATVVEEVRIDQLALDRPLAQSLFKPVVPAGAKLGVVDAGFRVVGGLGRVRPAAGYRPLVPLRVPAGFALGQVTVARKGQSTGKEGMNPPSSRVVSIAYRRGFDRLLISTRLIGSDASRWTDPLAAGEGYLDKVERVTLRAGALKGRAAAVVIDLRGIPHLWVLGSRLVVTVAGDLTRAELLAVAESLEPYAE